MYLLFVVSIIDSQETLGKEDLEFFDEEIPRIINADKCANDVTGSVCSEVCRLDQLR